MNKELFSKDMESKTRAIQHIRDGYDDLRIELEELEKSLQSEQALLRLQESRMWFEVCVRA